MHLPIFSSLFIPSFKVMSFFFGEKGIHTCKINLGVLSKRLNEVTKNAKNAMKDILSRLKRCELCPLSPIRFF